MSWLVMQGWLTLSALLCDVSALFNWRSAGPNAARELCFLTSSGWSMPSIQPTLLQRHQSLACQFAQTASQYLLCWLHVLQWFAKHCSLKIHTWCLLNMHIFPEISFSEVSDTFWADQNIKCVIRVIYKLQWGILFLLSDVQPCGNHCIFTCSTHSVPSQIGSLHITHLFNDSIVLCKCLF